MTDWKVGDLAVCVDASTIYHHGRTSFGGGLVEGRHYEVIDVIPALCERCSALVFRDGPPEGRLADRFRKVQHDKPEACETAFTVLLNRSKRRVEA